MSEKFHLFSTGGHSTLQSTSGGPTTKLVTILNFDISVQTPQAQL